MLKKVLYVNKSRVLSKGNGKEAESARARALSATEARAIRIFTVIFRARARCIHRRASQTKRELLQ